MCLRVFRINDKHTQVDVCESLGGKCLEYINGNFNIQDLLQLIN